MFVRFLTRTVAAVVAAFDTCCFRRRLKRKISILEEVLSQTTALHETAAQKLVRLEKDEESARAQLMQLRVHQESVKHRTGFMVSAFIPEGVLKQLRHSPERTQAAFRDRVAGVLVSHALLGLYRVSAHGKMTAMIFEPLGPESNKRIVTPIFETDERDELGEKKFKAVHTSPTLSPDVTKRLTEGGVL